VTVTLSRMYRDRTTTGLVQWKKITKREICDECIARQFETKGTTTRKPARTVRTTSNSTLLLCHEHAEAWRERDRGE
jgi:hypothetical protein